MNGNDKSVVAVFCLIWININGSFVKIFRIGQIIVMILHPLSWYLELISRN